MCSLTGVIISLGFELPRTSSDLPEDLSRASWLPTFRKKPADVFLFGLASGDAYRAGDVTTTAVGSYPTVSPLPEPRRPDWNPVALAIGGLFSVVLVSDRSAWELPSALPVKSGLSSQSVTLQAITQSSPSRQNTIGPDVCAFKGSPRMLRPTEQAATAPQAPAIWSGK